ncbi:hypothetical protein NIES4075_14510 [Tolypothrix sp. NIES-4075]|nr:hypothetical protein NIES4075_14510 [Tolypothrix sp. NIES-4075]
MQFWDYVEKNCQYSDEEGVGGRVWEVGINKDTHAVL